MLLAIPLLFALTFPGGARGAPARAFSLDGAHPPAAGGKFTLTDTAPEPLRPRAFYINSFGHQTAELGPHMDRQFRLSLDYLLRQRTAQTDIALVKYDEYVSDYLEQLRMYDLPLDEQLKMLRHRIRNSRR